MAAPAVAIVGMAALRRDIKRLTDDQQSALYAGIKAAGKSAAEPVAALTRASLPMGGTGTLAGDVRTSGTKTGAAVRMGRASIAYAGWVEFGGNRPDGSSREYRPGGRYLFPAAKSLAMTSGDLYSRAIGEVLNSERVWTNTTSEGEQVHD